MQGIRPDAMVVNAGRVLDGSASLGDMGQKIFDLVLAVASGQRTRTEIPGHQEFRLTHKSFEPLGPSCLPV